ncbi:hypothetical protein ACKBF6_002222 [Vibrio cholerae]|uniref:hypothetical protein n=1 Tax=Vibrio cholerae TaxID=666 RepID=UPI002934A8F8|nr:hypothetical protein [Vibrio cholerae]MDV2397108.1 hypothetical protein [Vibrio cholerae]
MLSQNLELHNLTDEEVLFFIRIRGKDSYFKNVYSHKFLSYFTSVREFKCISEYEKDAHIHIDLNSVPRTFLLENEFADFSKIIDVYDVILRCRGLRNIPLNESKELISRAYLFFRKFYNENSSLKLIVMGAIDNYVMDIMVRVGSHFGVSFIGVTDSLMSPQYKLVTVRGELNAFSEPKLDNIHFFSSKILTNLNSRKTPVFINVFKRFIYDFSSSVYRNVWRYCFKYKILGRLEYEYRFATVFHSINIFDQLYALKYLDYSLDSLELNNKIAYIPLHFYPEATTDYWIDDLFYVDYYNSLKATVIKLQKLGYSVITKEHPHFFMRRHSGIYKELVEIGCRVLSPWISTKSVFEIIDLVVVYNGSTGIEAILDGKKVVRMTNSYYGDSIIPRLEDNIDIGHLPSGSADECLSRVFCSSFRTEY